jgi:L-2,4-diaminobutyrate decarboxylase
MESELFDPALFERVGKAIIEETRHYLDRARSRPYPSLKAAPPERLIARAGELLDRRPEDSGPDALVSHARALARQFLEDTIPLHSPHYIGHQVPPPIALSAAFAAVGAVSNPGAAVFEMGPSSIAAEKALSARMGTYLGWQPGTFDSIVTHGGSLANLTAILAARNARYPGYWSSGATGQGRKPAILAGGDAHYSVARAAGIAGLGASSVIKVKLDSRRRMDPVLLSKAYQEALDQGFEPFCVVSSSCSTPVGAFDPIEPIAELARKEGLWLHVDAAHGGGLLLSKRHRGLLQGIDRADSVTWDAHKMMFVPALSTFLFYREAKNSYRPFEQDAPYLFDPEADASIAYDPGLRTVECTKGPLSIVLWALWSCFGPEAIGSLVDRVIETTRAFHELLLATEDFVPLHEPEANILCFRYLPPALRGASPERVSQVQLKLRQALLNTGRFYITGTKLDGAYALRVTVMNPEIKVADLEDLLSEIRSLA